jgi:hypothetical protein
VKGRLFPTMRAAGSSSKCAATLVELDRFPLDGGAHATTMGATPVPVHAIPFVRDDEDIAYVERFVDAAAKLGDPHAEGFRACLSWLRGQRATAEVLVNYADDRGELPA